MKTLFNFFLSERPKTEELEHALRQIGAYKLGGNLSSVRHSLIVTSGSKPPKLSFPARTGKLTAQAGPEGFIVSDYDPECLALGANTEKGLANGVYNLRLRLGALPEEKNPARLLPPGPHPPAFPYRDVYHFQSPWRLQNLSMDTFGENEWTVHLDYMRSLNVNRLFVDFWSDQLYHPAFPDTGGNKLLWEKIYRVFSYARKIGLRTGFYIFPCMVPVSQYLAHPAARAVEAANYYGLDMCWTRARKDILPFGKFIIEYFNDVFDDLVIEMEDPGACLCAACCDNFADIVLDIVDTYRNLCGNRPDRHVDLCTLHFRDWIETPGKAMTGVAHPARNLRRKVFAKLPKNTLILDIDEPTMRMARRYGLKCGYFFFDLDPESGIEDQQVLPRVHLKRIERQIGTSMARGDRAIQAYRMMPQARFVTDYVLFRKCWNPSLPTIDLLSELGGSLGLERDQQELFAESMLALDDWWTMGRLDKLEEARDKLKRLNSKSQRLTDLQDLVDVLAILGEYFVRHRNQVKKDGFYPEKKLVNLVYDRMRESRIFQAYTVHQHWICRSREIIGQRIRWWFQGMERELPGRPSGFGRLKSL